MSETPRTDAVVKYPNETPMYMGPEMVPADFARQLERELAASEANLAEMTQHAKGAIASVNEQDDEFEKCKRDLAAAVETRAAVLRDHERLTQQLAAAVERAERAESDARHQREIADKYRESERSVRIEFSERRAENAALKGEAERLTSLLRELRECEQLDDDDQRLIECRERVDAALGEGTR